MDQANTFVGLIAVRWMHAEPRFLLLRHMHLWDFPKYSGLQPADKAGLFSRVKNDIQLTDLNWIWDDNEFTTAPYGSGYISHFHVGYNRVGEFQLLINPQTEKANYDEYRWFRHRDAKMRIAKHLEPALDWAYHLVSAQPPEDAARGNVRMSLGLYNRRRSRAAHS